MWFIATSSHDRTQAEARSDAASTRVNAIHSNARASSSSRGITGER